MSKNSMTLLFVDDEPLILQSLSLLFEDYTVLTASNGDDALRIVQKNSIDVIISDQRMPGMTGVELLKTVKEISPRTMRILMTGYSDLEAVIDSVNAGEVFRYINKPWRADKLRETVQFACSVAMQRAQVATHIEAQQTVSAQSITAPSNLELLFIDTKESHLQSFKDFFTPKYNVHTATSANAALEILRQRSVAVVSCDVQIGEVDGIDFLSAIRVRYPDIVTILMTDTRDAKVAVRMINEGQVYRYLVKPFPRETLRLTVESAVIRYKLHIDNPLLNSKRQEAGAFKVSVDESRSLGDQLALLRQQIASRPIY
ncbi:MAG: response regulator [Rhizobacter sp.]|nr:response regulator [Chlorobiales bacterium]